MQKIMWNNVKEMIEKSGITASELSRTIGKSDNYISQCIKENRNPTIDIVIAIANYFKLEPMSLLREGTARDWYRGYLQAKKAEIEKELKDYED